MSDKDGPPLITTDRPLHTGTTTVWEMVVSQEERGGRERTVRPVVPPTHCIYLHATPGDVGGVRPEGCDGSVTTLPEVLWRVEKGAHGTVEDPERTKRISTENEDGTQRITD